MKRLIVLMLVLGLSVSAANAGLISGIVVRDSDGAQIAPNLLADGELAYMDRTHEWENVPAALQNAEYIMTSNNDRDNRLYEMDVTLSKAATLYMWVDNRVGDGQSADGPTIGMANPNVMLWLDVFGWTSTGETIDIDEGGSGSIDQTFLIYSKDVGAGMTTLYAQDYPSVNMYGVAAVPEPMTIALLGLGGLGLLRRKRS